MPDLGKLLNWEGKATTNIGGISESEGVEYLLGHQGVSITVVRAGAALAAQTMAIVPASRSVSEAAGGGIGAKMLMYVIGLPTLDLEKGDRFAYGGAQYTIMYVDRSMAGKVEAQAEAME